MTTTRFQDMTVKELTALCKERGITGYSGFRKAELIQLIEKALEMEAEEVEEEPVVSEAGGEEITCLSLEPAMAYAVAHLGKDIENRSWRTNYKGWLYIHASKSKTHYHIHRRYIESLGLKCPDWEDLPKGCLVCRVWLDRVSAASAPASLGYVPWGINGQYWWFLRDAQPVKHVPMKGQLGLFKAEVSARVISEAGGDIEVNLTAIEEETLMRGREATFDETKASFAVGDLVVINGYMMDGEKAVVLGGDKNTCSIALITTGRCHSIPSSALTLAFPREIEEYLKVAFQQETVDFKRGQLPQFGFELNEGIQYIEDALDATETHFILLAKRNFTYFCGYANLVLKKGFVTTGEQLSVSLKFAQLKILTNGETVIEAFEK